MFFSFFYFVSYASECTNIKQQTNAPKKTTSKKTKSNIGTHKIK